MGTQIEEQTMNNTKTNEISQWNQLFKIGGIAPFVTLAFYLIQLLTISFSREPYPVMPEEWFTLLHNNPILGLIFLNALDIFSVAILGLMFLALTIALWQVKPTWMLVAAFLAFLGIAAFVSSRANMVTATLALTEQYAAAGTAAQSTQILAAGQAVMVLSRATPETIGFLFVAVASLIISIMMLKTDIFNNGAGYLGILGFVITLANHIYLVLAYPIAAALMPMSGLIWLIWWIWVGIKLLQLERSA
jgi:hypothetical protein